MIKGAINRSAVGTVGVDDLDRLPFVQTSRAAAPCRYNLKICRHIAIPLPLAHWRICPVGILVVGQRAKGQATSRRRRASNGLRLSTAAFAFATHRHRTRTTPLALGARHTRCAQLMWRRSQRTSEVPLRRGANASPSRVKPLF